MNKKTIAVPTNDAHARMNLAAQLTIAAASLAPRVNDDQGAIDRTLDLYTRITQMIEEGVSAATSPKEGNQ